MHENGRVYKILNDAIQAVVTGEKAPAAAMKDAQAQSARILRRYQ